MENRFFCVYFASVGGGRPVSRHRTLEAARRAARRQQRGLERAYPGGLIRCGYEPREWDAHGKTWARIDPRTGRAIVD